MMMMTMTMMMSRGSVMSGTDLTSYSAVQLSDYQASRRAEIQAELSERA